jgi:hypothetical protein
MGIYIGAKNLVYITKSGYQKMHLQGNLPRNFGGVTHVTYVTLLTSRNV